MLFDVWWNTCSIYKPSFKARPDITNFVDSSYNNQRLRTAELSLILCCQSKPSSCVVLRTMTQREQKSYVTVKLRGRRVTEGLSDGWFESITFELLLTEHSKNRKCKKWERGRKCNTGALVRIKMVTLHLHGMCLNH